MGTKNETKINKLLQLIPKDAVVLSSWLVKQGYSHDLQQKYLRSNWLEPLGKGAYKRKGEKVGIFGALYALQSQVKKEIYIGGVSSLALQGYSHYIEMDQNLIRLFAPHGFRLPAWFLNYSWDMPYELTRTNMLPFESGLTTFDTGSFPVKISSPARAMLECLELAPVRCDLEEAWFIMESLNSLQPKKVQELLEECQSVKSKRLFMYFAEKAGHTWFNYLESEKINLGSGKRSIVKQGVWISKYQITVPKNLA